MNIGDLVKRCVEQINLQGNTAEIVMVLPGKCNKSMTKRLCPGGPIGQINGDAMGESGPAVVVFFGAMDVLAFLTSRGLVKAVGPDGKDLLEEQGT